MAHPGPSDTTCSSHSRSSSTSATSQRAAFAEVCRVARHAIISLPIEWEMDDPRNPHHGITHERVLSWFAPIEPTRVIVGNPGYRQRLIYAFENLG